MHTTATLDDDARCGTRAIATTPAAPLPLLPGRSLLDIADVSALLAPLDDERRAERDLPSASVVRSSTPSSA